MQPSEINALARELSVPQDRKDAFAEYCTKTAEVLGRICDKSDVINWKEDLAKTPAEADILSFINQVAAKRIDPAMSDEKLRAALVDRFIFSAVYGKKANGSALPFEDALKGVLAGLEERATARAPSKIAYRKGTFTAKHLAIRKAAFPYVPACGSRNGDATVDAVEEASGALLGYICPGPDGYIDDLSVLPRYQSVGIAHGLVTAAASFLLQDGVARIHLHVRALNKPAIRLYAKLGMSAGENEYPAWYDWHGGYALEGSTASVAAMHGKGGKATNAAAAAGVATSTGSGSLAPAPAAAPLPDFVSLFSSIAEARAGSRSQSGASNCGATAVATQLRALGVKENPNGEVTVRSRDYSTPSLWRYLQSRSNAGCTADDLVTGAGSLSGGACVATFYPTGPEPPAGLVPWLAEMVSLGATPIATINTQLDGADYWHHQAVLGVFPKRGKVMLANPCEEVDESELARLLGSGSEMLIFREDVTRLCPVSEADLKAMGSDRRWKDLQVAEQVREVMAGGKARGSGDRVIIPASYTPGVTLIAKAGSEAATRIATAGGVGKGPWRK